MQALTRTAEGPGSLREEEWEEWYYARIDERRAREGLPPTPMAVDPTEGAQPTESEPEAESGGPGRQ